MFLLTSPPPHPYGSTCLILILILNLIIIICRGLDSTTHGLATAADVVVFIIILKGLKLFHDGSFWLFSVRSVCVLNMMDECACASHSAQSLTLSQSKI